MYCPIEEAWGPDSDKTSSETVFYNNKNNKSINESFTTNMCSMIDRHLHTCPHCKHRHKQSSNIILLLESVYKILYDYLDIIIVILIITFLVKVILMY